MAQESNIEKTIKEYEKKQKKDRRDKIFLIIIIIILLLIYLLGYRLGKIGYQQVSSTPNNSDSIKLIKVTGNDIEITKDTQLDIFNNEKFGGEKIIAPKSSGTYKFCIENVTEKNITYNIKFTDEMNHFINMKYRLKIDNVYIKGNKDTYVSLNELNTENIIVLEDSINLFTLEWYWEDDDQNDTTVGSQKADEHYKLNMEIEAKEHLEQR